MKNLLKNVIGLLCFGQIVLAQQTAKRIVCYYDSESSERSGFAELPHDEMKNAMEFCTHLVYGYAGLTPEFYDISSLSVHRDMFHYRQVTALKTEYPHLKVYLSLGGDKNRDASTYLKFLKSSKYLYQNFVQTSRNLLQTNGFDGLDLAFPFPRNKPRKVHSKIGMWWKKFKKLFTGNFIVDTEAETHKKKFTSFVEYIHRAYEMANLSLTLTVLPNVNSSWYFDIPKIHNRFEFINLFAFDFLTPQRNPEEADYTAPIYLKDEQNRLPHYTINFQVQHWISNGCPSHKLNLGIATYARAWKTTDDSSSIVVPVVSDTDGPAAPGLQSQKEGLFSWPEVCTKSSLSAEGKCIRIIDKGHKYGNYAFCPSNRNNGQGIWMSFDDPDFAGVKAEYAKRKDLGGVILFDISYDDFRGLCTGEKYPILRSVKQNLHN